MTRPVWWCRFRSTLLRTLQYVEPELIECPAVMLLVVASHNEVRRAKVFRVFRREPNRGRWAMRQEYREASNRP